MTFFVQKPVYNNIGDIMKKLIFILTAIIFLFGCNEKEIYIPETFETTDKNMIMSFSDLTYGKSLVTELPSGEILLIDCGSSEDFPKLYGALRQMEAEKIDYVIITSDKQSTLGGLKKLSSNFDIGDIFVSQHMSNINDLKNICKNNSNPSCSLYLITEGTRIYEQDKVSIDVIFSGMCEKDKDGYPAVSLYISYNNISMLYEGDGDYIAEREFVSTMDKLLCSDILVIPHQGTEYIPSDELLEVTKPKYAVIQIYSDVYPMKSTLDRLKEKGTEIFRTDHDGTITFVTDGKEINIYKER